MLAVYDVGQPGTVVTDSRASATPPRQDRLETLCKIRHQLVYEIARDLQCRLVCCCEVVDHLIEPYSGPTFAPFTSRNSSAAASPISELSPGAVRRSGKEPTGATAAT
jgi:hypothetical protein